ncbi:uncharacterized protein LOC132268548 [Cornus florida]|uniref:uncharacterized protein LOC132268548 n=1 Tax=Cornus florida TaxID=4283 RepID=UPI0028A2CF42|nr:uncharacterized protein LOC132268548 [Cornus florida]
MAGRNVVDVSSFLLFEATGDSEADSDLNMVAMTMEVDVADDDAQSCSCDSSDCTRVIEFDDDCDDDLDYELHTSDSDDDDESEEEEDQEAIDHRDWTGDSKLVPPNTVRGLVTAAGLQKTSRTCVESTMEMINEIENNRLFWEACLAS